MIKIKGISKNFGELKVLKDINLNINKGEFVVFLGVNGCGKSTILRIIAGLEKPTVGEVVLEGEIGFIFQDPALLPWRNVEENIKFGLEIKKTQNKENIIKKYINYFGLEGFEKYYPSDLSGGMKQKLVLARTLATDPSVILMDEPFANMDIKSKKRVEKDLIETWKKTRKTILFVTHNIEEALFLADRIILFGNTKPTEIVKEFKGFCEEEKDKIRGEIKKFLFSS